MSRKRKTKKQKVITALRRQQASQNIHSYSSDENNRDSNSNGITENNFYRISTENNFKNEIPAKTIIKHQRDYSYISGEINKTISVVFVIIIINLTLFLLLTKNILSLKFLGL